MPWKCPNGCSFDMVYRQQTRVVRVLYLDDDEHAENDIGHTLIEVTEHSEPKCRKCSSFVTWEENKDALDMP